MKNRGFTKVEVVLVLAVSGVAAMLLLPVFAQTPQQAPPQDDVDQQSQCLSNLKKVALGLLLYNQDYDEWYPPAASGSSRGHGWADLLYPDYVKERSAFSCPTEKRAQSSNPRQPGYTDYWYNRNFAGKNIAVVGMDGSTLPSAQTLMLGDGDGAYAASNARYSLNALPQSWLNLAESPARRHRDGANYAFPDGHVKWLLPNQVVASSSKEDVYGFALPKSE